MTFRENDQYKKTQSNRQNTRIHYAANGSVYGFWSCKATDRPLRKLGLNRANLTLYGCPEHRAR